MDRLLFLLRRSLAVIPVLILLLPGLTQAAEPDALDVYRNTLTDIEHHLQNEQPAEGQLRDWTLTREEQCWNTR